MGAGPSLCTFLKSINDDDLAKLIESVRESVFIDVSNTDTCLYCRIQAYKLEPQRIEKMFSLARQHYFEGPSQIILNNLQASQLSVYA
ncbi:uncharacterized protein CCR75_006627 [Bremia lactucae]|uniref:Uncharacterized protein n=1 Tax=Bremia lactucae TaxID=4779 RepID=A0A976FE71_BRELC|nr:hypothetical protein CCR75_006627 [Bremia lactucae]